MNKVAYILIAFGVIIILFPAIVAYILGGIIISIGFSMFAAARKFGKTTKNNNSFKFGDYKIYRNKD